jgi:hypothetical protein
MPEERLWKFRKPEWMNSSTARSAGVYAAGALVRFVSCVLRLRLSLVLLLHLLPTLPPAPSRTPKAAIPQDKIGAQTDSYV